MLVGLFLDACLLILRKRRRSCIRIIALFELTFESLIHTYDRFEVNLLL